MAALDWRRSHEDTAREAYIWSNTSSETYQVDRTGIHICTQHPWLAASPDGLVEDSSEIEGRKQWIFEIKCPYSARTMTPEAACRELNRSCSNLVDGQISLKKTCNYHFQVQDQLAITQRRWCDLYLNSTWNFNPENKPRQCIGKAYYFPNWRSFTWSITCLKWQIPCSLLASKFVNLLTSS